MQLWWAKETYFEIIKNLTDPKLLDSILLNNVIFTSHIQKHEVNTPEEHRRYTRKPRCEWVGGAMQIKGEGLQAEWQMSHLASREVSLSDLMCCDYSLSPAGSSLLHQSQRLDVQQRDSDRENSDKHTQELMLAHTNLIKQDNSFCKHTYIHSSI